MIRSFVSFVALVALALGQLQAQSANPGAAKPAGQGGPVVNLNTASSAELQALPGIGATTAGRIIEYRQKNGPFKKIEEVMNVQGIGEKMFLRLKPQLSVGTGAVPVSQQP
jgi:competence protein ComEA